MNDNKLVCLTDASNWFPKRNNRPLSSKAIRRRIIKGSKGVKLEAVRDGGEWFTCQEWVENYLRQLTEASLPKPATPRRTGTPSRVKRSLARYGIHAAK